MSFFTYAELLKGAEGSDRKAQVTNLLSQLIKVIPVAYDVNFNLCQHCAIQFLLLEQVGTPIRANDLWIACHALSKNATLITHNIREFERVAGLGLDDWARE